MLISAIREIISGNFDFASFLARFASILFVIFCTFPVHEAAHAWMAHKLGDDTGRLSGRMTLKPMAHFDPIGALMILLIGVGFAKPVPVNIRNFKNRKLGFALTALAGPVSNLIMGFFCFFFSVLFSYLSVNAAALGLLIEFFSFAGSVNVTLAVFNFIPIPPLDGSRLITVVLPDRIYYKVLQYERYIMIAVFVLYMAGILSIPIAFFSDLFIEVFIKASQAILGIFF